MTLQQMEYIVALDKYRHFVLAAEACGVTQPTLSAMIQKLEEELDVKIFSRDRKNIYNPQNEMFRLLGTKRSFSQNETFFFSHP